MANGKRQIATGSEDHLPFALCHLPFAISFLLTDDCYFLLAVFNHV
jgi:hypothetical protein